MASLEIGASCSNLTSELKTTCIESKEWSNGTWSPYANCTVSLNSGVTLWYLPDGGAAQPIVINTVLAISNTFHQSSIFPVIQYILATGSNHNPAKGGGVSSKWSSNLWYWLRGNESHSKLRCGPLQWLRCCWLWPFFVWASRWNYGNLCNNGHPGIYILHKPHKLKLSGRRSTDLRYKKRCFCNVENSSRWSIYRQC